MDVKAEVAADIGLYTTTYQRYERGEREIPLDIAICLAKYYNVSLDYLAGLRRNRNRLQGENTIWKLVDRGAYVPAPISCFEVNLCQLIKRALPFVMP